eukprot:gene41665-51629_t
MALAAGCVAPSFVPPLSEKTSASVDVMRQVLAANDGWGAAEGGTRGGADATPEHVFDVRNRSELSARPTAAWSAASAGAKALSSSLTFTITSSGTIKGAFLTTVATKDGTTGTLISAGLFAGGDQPVAATNTKGDKVRQKVVVIEGVVSDVKVADGELQFEVAYTGADGESHAHRSGAGARRGAYAVTSLRDQVHADQRCAAALTAKDCAELARLMSVGRVRANSREIGNGTILEVLGLATGNEVLDLINSNADYRHVKPLIEQGRLLIGSPLAQITVQALVPAVLTQAQADALCALGLEPHPYTAQELAEALFTPDGTENINATELNLTSARSAEIYVKITNGSSAPTTAPTVTYYSGEATGIKRVVAQVNENRHALQAGDGTLHFQ